MNLAFLYLYSIVTVPTKPDDDTCASTSAYSLLLLILQCILLPKYILSNQ